MDLATIKTKAEGLGIDTAALKGKKKAEIVHAIQAAEGHDTCYGSRTEGCPYVLCCFMVDCYKEAKAAQKPKAPAKKAATKKAAAPARKRKA
ncbi:MAG: hypothetical protein GF331_00810 [Chitinivibrionales bacterium]|nr:hypothetical protein [Chitinivibrionales bacterium]